MKPYLVRARIPDIRPPDNGAATLFVAYGATEAEALSQVQASAPPGWTVDEVVGIALDSYVERHRLRPGAVTRY